MSLAMGSSGAPELGWLLAAPLNPNFNAQNACTFIVVTLGPVDLF